MDKLPRIPSPPGTVWREFRVTVLPFVVFAVVLGLTVVSWRNYVGPSALVGEVEAVRSVIASAQPGRVTQLKVTRLQRVKAGDPLLQVLAADPKVLDAQLSLNRAQLAFLRQGVDSKVRQQNNRINFAKLRLDWLAQRVELAAVRARTNYLAGELERGRLGFMGLGTNGVGLRPDPGAVGYGSFAAYQLAEADMAEAEAQIVELAKLIDDIELVMTQMTPEEAKLAEDIPNAIKAAIAVQEQELRLLEIQLAPVTFTAPMDAVVAAINHREGENVVAGEPILILSAVSSDRIIAYLRQPLNFEARTNQPVEVRARSHQRDLGQGRILSIGTQMEPILPELLPARASGGLTASGPSVTGPTEYGLPIVVSLPVGMKLLPGEIVDLRPLD